MAKDTKELFRAIKFALISFSAGIIQIGSFTLLNELVFGEEKAGKIIEKGTMCKMARGEMVRWMAENQITEPDLLPNFDRLQYRFAPDRSDAHTLVFLRQPDAASF